jgi:cytochrome P450
MPVPGPRGSWLLGVTPALQRDQVGTFEKAMLEHGDVARLVTGPPGLRTPLYLISHPDGVRRVLVDNAANYTKETPVYREIAAYLGSGLVNTDGQEWRRQRRTAAPLFTPRRTARHVPDMVDSAALLAKEWIAAGQVDLHAELTTYALRAVGHALFGAGFSDAAALLRTTFPMLSEYAVRRGLNPLRLPRTWPTPRQRRVVRAQRELHGVLDEIIAERRAAPGDDIVSLLLASRDPETGESLTVKEIRDQAMIFLLAGHETAATSLTFTCYLLGAHPLVQQEVQRELDAVLGPALPRAEDLAKLTYTTMVIKEAMRLYPSGHATMRIAAADDHIAGHTIPAGAVVIISPWVTHRHPTFWPDPQAFDPGRFEPSVESARPRYAYLPFGAGPRVCIGQHFAMAELTAAVAVLLSCCTLETDPTPPALTLDTTLRPADAVPCAVTPRA